MCPETSAVSHCWNRDFLKSWKSFLHIIKYYAEFCNFISYPSVTVFRIPKILLCTTVNFCTFDSDVKGIVTVISEKVRSDTNIPPPAPKYNQKF